MGVVSQSWRIKLVCGGYRKHCMAKSTGIAGWQSKKYFKFSMAAIRSTDEEQGKLELLLKD